MITLGDLKTPQGSLLRTHLTHIEFIEHSAVMTQRNLLDLRGYHK